jgi:hypothetical protein
VTDFDGKLQPTNGVDKEKPGGQQKLFGDKTPKFRFMILYLRSICINLYVVLCAFKFE